MEFLTGENLKTFQNECVENTKIITSRHMFNASLKNLCMNTIIDSLRRSSKVTIDIQRLADLPLVLRQELLKKLCYANATVYNEEEAISTEVRFRVASSILEQIFEFNLRCMSPTQMEQSAADKGDVLSAANMFAPLPYEQQIFALLAQKCRKSLQSVIQYHSANLMNSPCTDFVSPALLGSLLKLDNLQHLELTRYAFKKSEFALLGSKLINLVYLNCNLVDVTPSILSQGLKPMKKLQVFIFLVAATDDKKENGCKLINCRSLNLMCMKEFPHLKVVGQNLNVKLNSCSFSLFFGKSQSFGVEDDTLYGPRCRSQLEHLLMNEPTSQSQIQWHSNVTNLYVTLSQFENMQDIQKLVQMKKVQGLILDAPMRSFVNNAADIIRRFLQVFGPQLNSLCIAANTKEMYFWEILRLCPNLTTLGIDCGSPNFDGFNPEIDDLQPFKKLTKIFFSDLDVSKNPEVLVLLFTAPKLVHLEMVGTTFGASSSAKALMDLRMKEEAIAPRLTTLKVIAATTDPSEQFNLPKRPKLYHHEFFLLIQFVCSKAPYLKDAVLAPWEFPLESTLFIRPINRRSIYHF